MTRAQQTHRSTGTAEPGGTETEPLNQSRGFGRRVREFRKDQGRTQTELAGTLGKSCSWLSQVERGIQPVRRTDLLQQIADELGISLQRLVSGHPAPPSTRP
ncbi:helix-turn-helix domain-containing protein [Streptomyces erythrochromogenes]|uniref:helix-turn-helix domain-containing protein n=1 Tax=Streptomyces erythrochromogenes TaxID=285574 RepID=UPI00381B7360